MMNQQEYLPSQLFLKPGYALADRNATIVRAVVGNSVAVAFFDQLNCFGGMNQFVFPRTDRPQDRTTQYGNVGIRALFRMLLDLGASKNDLVAQIIGGADCRMFDDGGLGPRNVDFARFALDKLRIPVISEDVGGGMGRKVIYHTGTNEVAVFKVDSLRNGDWFKPGMDLRYDCFDR